MRIAGLAAATLVALIAGAANAQPPADEGHQQAVPMPVPTATSSESAPTTSAVPGDVTAPGSSSVTYQTGNATLTNTVVTNGPVADTPENRAKYGQPMSQAGKRTVAKGN